MTSERFVLATANPDKAREIRQILTEHGPSLELAPRPTVVPEVAETADRLEDNARLKASALAQATGLPAIADDTGLQVDALAGAPGVRSARFAGEEATDDDNVRHLLAALAAVPPADRGARFATVAIARWPDGREVAAFGETEGAIAAEAAGTGGFGYDPVFVPTEGDGRTFAEMSATEKHRLSHRGRAFRTLAQGLSIVALAEASEDSAGD